MSSTRHIFETTTAERLLAGIEAESVDLILTSPPYPMIEMWDQQFIGFDAKIGDELAASPMAAFESMHQQLDEVWRSAYRSLKSGGHLIVNIGDATRTLQGNFQLFPNHSRILQSALQIGFQNLPNIIWRKQTNAPNKFMGSGMLPPGAYVTLEHEYILIFRKGEKREFRTAAEKLARSRSAYFWEERNHWFSDLWDFKGVRQALSATGKGRERSGAFPFELAWRILLMFSVQGDLVVDPFGGTGTTSHAAIASARNSIYGDCEKSLSDLAIKVALAAQSELNEVIESRLRRHVEFIEQRHLAGKDVKYLNESMGFPVMTRQEQQIVIPAVEKIGKGRAKGELLVEHSLAKPVGQFALAQ